MLAAIGVSVLGAEQTFAAPVPARPAYRFVDAVGVAAKFSWGTSVYRTRYPQAKAALAELGIRHIRDQVGNEQAMQVYRDLHGSLSVRLTAIVDTRRGGGSRQRLDPSAIAGELQRARSGLGTRILAALEGPNEYNILERDYGYRGWVTELRAYQAALFRQVRENSALRSLPVLAPSVGGPDVEYYHRKLGNIGAWSDHGNGHVYGNWFSLAQKVDEVLPYTDMATPGQRYVLTETGWHTAYNAGKQHVPEDTRIRYLPRAMAEFATHSRVRRGFIYQLVDPYHDPDRTRANAHFGLLDHHMQKKRSFYAVRNMMHIMCDDPPSKDPSSLNFTLSGNLADVRAHLFQKRSGSFSLLLWLEKPLHGRDGRIVNPPRPVTVQFNQPITVARRYLPSDPDADLTNSHWPKQTYWEPTRVSLEVPDHMLVLEVFPRGVPITPVYRSCNFRPS